MTRIPRSRWLYLGLAVAALNFTVPGVSEEPPEVSSPSTADRDEKRDSLTLEEARSRALLLHQAYEATLRAMHRHYFREDGKQPVPSRVLEEVFSEMARRWNIEARWIAVNAQVMSLGHEPKDEFEKQAARQLASGKDQFEQVENGAYRRAGAIALFSSCLKCHAPAPMRPDAYRVAGLVISVPLKQD